MKNIFLSTIASILLSAGAFAQVDRSQLPASGPAPEINIGEAETFTLDNGLKVFVVENDKLPRVSFTLVLERDPLLEGEKAGLTGFVGQMMKAGTENRTKEQLDQEIDFIGAGLSVGATSVFATSLKKHQDKILELMADVLYNPVFPEEEMEKLRKQSLTGLATSKDDPNSISSRLTSAVVFGKDHPYGEVETEETINAITVEDVKAYYETYFKPNIAYLAIVGDMDKKEAEEVVEKYFADWEEGEVPTFEYPEVTRSAANTVSLVDRSSSVQTVLSVTQPVNLVLGDEDYIPSRLLNQVLGGGSSSRLFMNLREDKGYTYGAYSSIGSDKLVARISAGASVRTEVTDSALVELLYEMRNIVDSGVTEEELEKAKASLSGSFGRSLESPSTIANFALNTERYDLPKDYYKTYLQELNSLTVEDINETAKRLIEPDKLYITAVGNGTEIKDKLEKFGELKMYDNMGFPAKEMGEVDPNLTVDQVLSSYLDAIGGAAKARSVKRAKVSMDADVMGNALNLSFVHDDENMRFSQKTSVAGNVMQAATLMDGKGTSTIQGQSMEMSDEQMDAAVLNSFFVPELHYRTMGYNLELDGIKDVEGTPAYKVIVTTPTGSSISNFYAVDSGLKIKNESAEAGETFYSNYQDKDGLLVPMTLTLKTPAIPMALEAKVVSLEINPTLTEEDFK